MLAELWQRLTTGHPAPTVGSSLLIGGLALTAVLLLWRQVRLLVTVCHEGGHASVAVLVGRRLSGIRLHSDTSGLTLSRGRERGPGMVATLFAGYPAAAVIGLLLAWLVQRGASVAALALLLVLLVLLLVRLRNFYGVLVVVLVAVGIGAATWWASPEVSSWLATGIAWLLLLAAPRPVLELFARRSPGSDAEQLAGLTRVPQFVWLSLWLVITILGALVGANWLTGGLLGALVAG